MASEKWKSMSDSDKAEFTVSCTVFFGGLNFDEILSSLFMTDRNYQNI